MTDTVVPARTEAVPGRGTVDDRPATEYDAVVIGSGVSGLSCAAVMARAGLHVLVVERAPWHGGCTRAIRSGGYTFDRAVHVTGQGAGGEIFDDLLRYLDVRDQVDLVPVGHYYAVTAPGATVHLPTGFEAFVQAHREAFPHEGDGLARFFSLCEQVHREAHFLPPSVGLKDLDAVAAAYPVLFAHTKATLADVLAEHVADPLARTVAAASWPYVGVPPSRLSFLTFTQMLFSQMEGTYYSLGSFQRIPDAFVRALRAGGGQIVYGAEVTRVDVEAGRVTGVRLADGRRVTASVVVSAGDPTRLLESLDGGVAPRSVQRVRRMRPSWSAFVLYAATSVDLSGSGLAHETFCYRHRDHADTDADIGSGRPGGTWVNIPTLIDPSVAPPGEHLLIMTSLAPYEIEGGWEAARPRYTADLVAQLELLCPALSGQIRVVETVAPPDLARDTGNRGGAIYGWDYVPQQSGSKRLPHRTEVDGLFLAGHWTQPGAATLRVLVSGIHTAQLALRSLGRDGAADLGFRDLPPI